MKQTKPKNTSQNTAKSLFYHCLFISLFIYRTGVESGGQLDCQAEGSGQSEKMGEQRLHEIPQRQSPALGVKWLHAGVHTGLSQDKKLFLQGKKSKYPAGQ